MGKKVKTGVKINGVKFKTNGTVKSSQFYNQIIFQDYYNRLKEYALNMFEWTGLPDTVDERFLELTLFDMGFAVFFYDDIMGYLCLTCAISGRLNVYRIPVDRRAYANNGYNKMLNNKDSVIIWNNRLHMPTELTIRLYAERLYNAQRTIDLNINAQKTPLFIRCEENERLSFKNLFHEYDVDEPVIYGDKSIGEHPLEVIKTDAPFLADKLYSVKNQIWNEAMTFIGINNANTDKKERLITNEVEGNVEQIERARENMLTSRQEACKEINRMFGLNIWCDYRDVSRETNDEEFEEEETEVVEDE